MNLIDFFQKQLNYCAAMNQVQLKKLRELEHPPHEAVELLGHIAKADLLWLQRLRGNSVIPANFRDKLSLAEIEDKLKESHEGWREFLNEYDEEGLNKVFAYQNIKGDSFENNMYDIVFHVLNHSTHHRAQISKILRQHEIVPPVMDYINYARTK